MFQEDKNEVGQMIANALAGIKMPEIPKATRYDDTAIKGDIANLKSEVSYLKEKLVNKKK